MAGNHEAKKIIQEDIFSLDEDIKLFIDNYIDSDYYGSIFLNGKWGSGKTSFINFISEQNKKQDEPAKIKNINIWKFNIKNTPYQDIYTEVFPIKAFLMKYMFIMIVILTAIILSITTFFGTRPIDKDSNTYLLIGILALSGLLAIIKEQLNKINLEHIYFKMLNKSLLKLKNKKKKVVIIFDDFDRIPVEYRKIIYPILDTISQKNIVNIIIGDYKELEIDNHVFIQKMINTRIELPEKLSGVNVWNNVTLKLDAKIVESKIPLNISEKDFEIFRALEDVFIKEYRTQRDANEFIELLERHYFKTYYNEINFGQFAVVAYIYLFNTNLYSWIVSNRKLLIGQSFHSVEEIQGLKDELETNYALFVNLIGEKIFDLTGRITRLTGTPYFVSQDTWSYFHPEITSPEAFIKYLPNNSNSGVKTSSFKEIFTKNYPDFLDWIKGNDVSVFQHYLMTIPANTLGDELLSKCRDNITAAFLENMSKGFDKGGFFSTPSINKIFSAFIKYLNRSGKTENDILKYITTPKYDFSETLVLLNRIVKDSTAKEEAFRSMIPNFSGSIMEQNFPDAIVYFCTEHTDTTECTKIIDSLLDLSNDKLFIFLSEHFTGSTSDGITTKKTLNITRLYYCDDFKSKLTVKINSFTLAQKNLLEEYQKNSIH